MSFESPDMAKDFPGLYGIQSIGAEDCFEGDDRPVRRKEVLVRRRDSRPERRGKGYRMFEEEDSEEELVADDSTRSPSKMKKHSKPSFKFVKREKFYKPKEKDKEKDRDREIQHHHFRDREKPGGEKEKDRGDGHKEGKKKEDLKLKWKKRKLLAPGLITNVSKIEQQRALEPDTEVKPIFGVPLAMAVHRSRCHDGILLPVIFRECIDYIEEFGLACEGIYRISGVKSKVQALKDLYNQGVRVYLHEHEPNIIASLLKLFLRELPEPVLTKDLMPKFEEASTKDNVKQKVELFQQLIEQLPTPNKLLLSWMIVHMTHVITKEKQNKMSLQNVSIVLSPTMQISHRVLNVLFTYSRILFKDTVIKRHIPPLKPVTSRWSLDLPESPTALEEELLKQESLLNQLHQDLMKGKDPDKEEQLWEVQRVVTQLKRKIKLMKKTHDTATHREEETVQEKVEWHKTAQRQKQEEVKKQLQVSKLKESEPEKTTPEVKKELKDKEDKAEEVEAGAEELAQSAEDDDKTPLAEEKVMPGVTEVAKEESSDASKVMKNEEGLQEETKPSEEVLETESASVMSASDADTPKEELAAETNSAEIDIEVCELTETNDQLPMTEEIEEAETCETEEKVEEETPDIIAPPEVPVEPSTHQDEPPVERDTTPENEDIAVENETGVATDILEVPLEFQSNSSFSSEDLQQKPHEVDSDNEADIVVHPADVSVEDLPPMLDSDEEADFETLQQKQNELLLEEEEQLALGDELRQKIETERSEIERLHQEIAELKAIREDLYDSEDVSSDSSDDYEDEENLQEILKELIIKNEQLDAENRELNDQIQQERVICLDVKVQIRMVQQKQLESSGGMLLMDDFSERDLIESLL